MKYCLGGLLKTNLGAKKLEDLVRSFFARNNIESYLEITPIPTETDDNGEEEHGPN